jgi:transposase
MSHDLRAMLDAIGYVTRYGIEWRALPVDFPPWSAVYAFFERWSARDLPRRLADRLRGRIRIACGRAELPTAAVIDAQTVRGADTVAAASAGYDAGKKTKGRKRNIATDCLGLLLMVTVTAASMQDRDGAHRLLALLRERFSTISLVWADGGYAGRLVVHQTLRQRHRVRRAARRLVRDYERKPEHHEAMVWWATVTIMTRRLTQELTGSPPPPRWGKPRPSRHAEPAA